VVENKLKKKDEPNGEIARLAFPGVCGEIVTPPRLDDQCRGAPGSA